MRLTALALLTLTSLGSAQTSQVKLTDAQLLDGSKKFYDTYLQAVKANNGKQLAELYHDTASIVMDRHSGNGEIRTLKMSGVQYKALLRSIPLVETPDLYRNPTFQLLKGGIVQIDTQRQSVSRGYSAPNTFYVQPDTAGRFWIIAEKGIQKVK